MPRVLGLFPAALVAARGGISANAFYRQLQAEGIAPRRAETLQLFKVARNIVDKSEAEAFRDIRRIPTASEIAQWPTRFRSGFLQNVVVTTRDKSTGQITAKTLSIKSEQPITREAAIAKAVSLASENSENYNQEIVGAVHVATYELVPGMLEG